MLFLIYQVFQLTNALRQFLTKILTYFIEIISDACHGVIVSTYDVFIDVILIIYSKFVNDNFFNR